MAEEMQPPAPVEAEAPVVAVPEDDGARDVPAADAAKAGNDIDGRELDEERKEADRRSRSPGRRDRRRRCVASSPPSPPCVLLAPIASNHVPTTRPSLKTPLFLQVSEQEPRPVSPPLTLSVSRSPPPPPLPHPLAFSRPPQAPRSPGSPQEPRGGAVPVQPPPLLLPRPGTHGHCRGSLCQTQERCRHRPQPR